MKDTKNASKVVRREARNALLELMKDSYYKFLVIDEGLIIVPLIGASAFRSFKSPVKDAPLPEGVNLKEVFSTPSRFGLNVKSIGHELDETLRMAIEVQG